MAWRLIEVGDTIWSVYPAAERGANSSLYQLVLSCRPQNARTPAVSVTYPLESQSKAAVFAQADALPHERIVAFLGERLT